MWYYLRHFAFYVFLFVYFYFFCWNGLWAFVQKREFGTRTRLVFVCLFLFLFVCLFVCSVCERLSTGGSLAPGQDCCQKWRSFAGWEIYNSMWLKHHLSKKNYSEKNEQKKRIIDSPKVSVSPVKGKEHEVSHTISTSSDATPKYKRKNWSEKKQNLPSLMPHMDQKKNKYKRETEWTLKINCWPNFWKITFSASCCCAQIGFKIQSWPDNLSILSTASEHKMFLEKKKIHISLKILLLCHRLSLQSPRAICFFPRRA